MNYSFYDSYDYAHFWTGREYEHRADVMALIRLLKQAHNERRVVIDVGGGMGRMVKYYSPFYKKAIIVDPSLDQMEEGKKIFGGELPGHAHVSFVKGIAQQLPFPSNYADLLICIRVSHHIENINAVIRESKRVLSPGGYFILEIANKIHMKARLRAIFMAKRKKLIFFRIDRFA